MMISILTKKGRSFMGTRNLTCVVLNGEYKVAQYGQWDGYPEGQGCNIVKFLRNMDEEKFRKALSKVRFATEEDHREAVFNCGGDRESEWITYEVGNRLAQKYPLLSRDTGAKVLQIIQDSYDQDEIVLKSNSLAFAGDSLFCEWCYVLDLDKRVLEVYKGFNQTHPLKKGDRFYQMALEKKKGYYPVKYIMSFDIDQKPPITCQEFLKILFEHPDMPDMKDEKMPEEEDIG